MSNTETFESKPHHGFNVMIKRKRKRMSQDQLGDKLNMYQGDISKLEGQENIDEETLTKIAEVLECPVAELRDFDIDKAMSSYSVINSNHTNNDSSQSYSGIYQTINNTSPELLNIIQKDIEFTQEKLNTLLSIVSANKSKS